MPYLGWAAGTLFGGIATSLLPAVLQNALGITIYGMFLAIIVPPARKNRFLCALIVLSMAASALFTVLPLIKDLSAGVRTILLTVVISVAAALLCPVRDEENAEGGTAA